MDLETCNISQDDNESDTSDEDLDDPEINSIQLKWNGIENKSTDIYHKWKRDTCFPIRETDGDGRAGNGTGTIGEPLQFMMLDSDFSVLQTHKIDPCVLAIMPENLRQRKEQSYNRLYGITEAGHSVLVNVFGFVPYFYALPTHSTKAFTEEVLRELQEALNTEIKKDIQNRLKTIAFHDIVQNSPAVLNIELVNISDSNIYDLYEPSYYKYEDGASSSYSSDGKCDSPQPGTSKNATSSAMMGRVSIPPIMVQEVNEGGKNGPCNSIEIVVPPKIRIKGRRTRKLKNDQTKILKIYCSLPKFVWSAAKILRTKGLITTPIWKGKQCQYQTYEASINHNIRFLTGLNLSGCTWIQIAPGNHFRRHPLARLSHCQIEVDCHYKNLSPVSNEDDLFTKIPPLRVMSFDIEVMVRPPSFTFPRGGCESVLQIGTTLATFRNDQCTKKIENHQNAAVEKFVFMLGSCDQLENTTVFSFESEVEMLESWRLFVTATDPDLIVGYNIKRFDLPYLLDRANNIKAVKLPYIGRVRQSETVARPILNRNKKPNKYDEKVVTISGRIIFDMMILVWRSDTKPGGSFKLVDVSSRYLASRETKEDISYKDIYKLQKKGPSTRKTLASYCVQDAKLPYLVMLEHNPNPAKNRKWNTLEYYIDKARISGTPLRYLVTKSLQYNTYYKIIRKQKNPTAKFVANTPRKSKTSKTTTSFSLKRRNSLPATFAPKITSNVPRIPPGLFGISPWSKNENGKAIPLPMVPQKKPCVRDGDGQVGIAVEVVVLD